MTKAAGKQLVNMPPKHVAEFISKPDLLPINKLLKLSAEERLDHALYGDRMELAGVLYKGFALMGLKEDLGHGGFRGGLAKRGIGKDTAIRAINLAKLSTRVSESNFAPVRHLSPKKLLILVSWTDAELNEFFGGEEVHGITLEDTQVNSAREIKSLIKEHRDENNELQQELNSEKLRRENAELERDHLKQSLDYIPDPDMLPAVVTIREESAVYAQQAINGVEKIESLFDLYDEHRRTAAMMHPAQDEIARSTLIVQLKAVHAKISTAINNFAEQHVDMQVNDEDLPIMSLGEAGKFYGMRQLLIRNQEIEELHRKNMREAKANKRQKPGPKVGSKRSKATA